MTVVLITLLFVAFGLGGINQQLPKHEKVAAGALSLILMVFVGLILGMGTVPKSDCQPKPKTCIQYEMTDTGWECTETK